VAQAGVSGAERRSGSWYEYFWREPRVSFADGTGASKGGRYKDGNTTGVIRQSRVRALYYNGRMATGLHESAL
jgi:hypothetical protein